MRWKLKAAIQRAVARLPAPVSNAAYYRLQRHFGGLRNTKPTSRLRIAAATGRQIAKHGSELAGKTFLEIGTGWVPVVPLGYWLMGAERTITLDVHSYLRADLVRDTVRYILKNEAEIHEVFGSLLDPRRFDDLARWKVDAVVSTGALLGRCGIEYRAPADASNTGLPAESVDFHTSCTVFEHIPADELPPIIEEASRVIRDGGLCIHRIDYGDHFSHSDTSISNINFLQFSEDEWRRYAGNRFMYANRLRHDDFIAFFESAGHQIVEVQRYKDPPLAHALENGTIRLDERFEDKSPDILSTTGACIITRAHPVKS